MDYGCVKIWPASGPQLDGPSYLSPPCRGWDAMNRYRDGSRIMRRYLAECGHFEEFSRKVRQCRQSSRDSF